VFSASSTFREHSRNIQGSFSEVSGNIQGTFSERSPPLVLQLKEDDDDDDDDVDKKPVWPHGLWAPSSGV